MHGIFNQLLLREKKSIFDEMYCYMNDYCIIGLFKINLYFHVTLSIRTSFVFIY